MYLLLDGEQDSGLQTVVLDRVHGAGRPGVVLVGGAGIIHVVVFASAPDHRPPAIGAF